MNRDFIRLPVGCQTPVPCTSQKSVGICDRWLEPRTYRVALGVVHPTCSEAGVNVRCWGATETMLSSALFPLGVVSPQRSQTSSEPHFQTRSSWGCDSNWTKNNVKPVLNRTVSLGGEFPDG